MVSQSQIDNSGGRWVELDRPRDQSFIKLDVGEEFVGRFSGSKDNPNFSGELVHVFELVDGTGSVVQFNGTVDFDRWVSIISPGDVVRIRRLDDQCLPPVSGRVRKPLQVYKFWRHEESG